MPPWQPAQLNAAVGGRREELGAPAGESLLEPSVAPAWRFGSSTQYSGRPMTIDDEQQHAEQLDALEAPALQHLVVVVRLAVGGQLDLGADLRAARRGVCRTT